jgi:hypothetical protein
VYLVTIGKLVCFIKSFFKHRARNMYVSIFSAIICNVLSFTEVLATVEVPFFCDLYTVRVKLRSEWGFTLNGEGLLPRLPARTLARRGTV